MYNRNARFVVFVAKNLMGCAHVKEGFANRALRKMSPFLFGKVFEGFHIPDLIA